MLSGDVHVDPGPLSQVKARYLNDPLNDEMINCKFVVQEFRAAIVSLRDINAGEELFMSYGEPYWAQHRSLARVIKLSDNG